jgi:hypothetical protein
MKKKVVKREYDKCPWFPHVESYRQLMVLFDFNDVEDDTKMTFDEMHTKVTGQKPSEDFEIYERQIAYVSKYWKQLKGVARKDGHNWPIGDVQIKGTWFHGALTQEEKAKVTDRNKNLKSGMNKGLNHIIHLMSPYAPKPIPKKDWPEEQKRIASDK